MKRSIIALLLAGTIALNAGCYGSFAVTKKVYDVNGSSDSKFLNSALLWVFYIVPVYEIAAFVDVFVFNVLEFYTGANPIGGSTKKHETVQSKGKVYDVVMGGNEISITETMGPDAGKTLSIVYDPQNLSWSLVAGGRNVVLASYCPRPIDKFTMISPNNVQKTMHFAVAR